MNATSPDRTLEPRWLTYSKATVFSLPTVIIWGFVCIFLLPKIRQICGDAGLDPGKFGLLWPATFFVAHYGRSILVLAVLAFVLLELVAPQWRPQRQLTVGIAIWVANATVLLGMTVMLAMVLVAAPGLAHH